ncbi:AAA family ATPase, partial [Magnetovibrio sp. PR-2]|uniref:AAA family ATPase n=1 Tax=Magnetovibrio sp. PR-2 TaxID=3120356 RepID=UPI002FCE1E36
MRSKLVEMKIRNLGCIGSDGLSIPLNDIACLVGKNNSGKSTVLDAYELAQGGKQLPRGARCKLAGDREPTEIILDIHIPEGIGNVAEEWKFVPPENPENLRIVRSRWQWFREGDKPERTTWKPNENAQTIEEGDWASEGNAAGLDNVFKSRLPAPIRVGSLEEPDVYHKKLLKLILSPISKVIKTKLSDKASDIGSALSALIETVKGTTDQHQDKANEAATHIDNRFSEVFPGMGLQINLNMSEPEIDPLKLLAEGSGIVFG